MGNLEIMRWAREKGMEKYRGKPYPWDGVVYKLGIEKW